MFDKFSIGNFYLREDTEQGLGAEEALKYSDVNISNKIILDRTNNDKT